MCWRGSDGSVFRSLQEVHLAVTSKGHGVFKGARWRMEDFQGECVCRKDEDLLDRVQNIRAWRWWGWLSGYKGGFLSDLAAVRHRRGCSEQVFLTFLSSKYSVCCRKLVVLDG